MAKIRVLLVDDHAVVREGLRSILETDDEIEIVGEAADGRRATEMAERLRPAVVVMDITLPELDGVEATRQIAKRSTETRVLILSMHGDDDYVRQSLRAGARGYLFKDSAAPDVLLAVKTIGRGGSYFSPAISKPLLEHPVGGTAEDNLALLTAREREVLQLIAEGRTNRGIAALLSVSVNTVETHRKHIMEKLDLHNTAAIVRFAVRRRVVS